MFDGLRRLVCRGEPLTRPLVELSDLGRRVRGFQPRAKHVGEQRVIAVPAALAVERHHEQADTFQCLENGLAGRLPRARTAEHRIAQRTAESVEYGGLQQEIADIWGLGLEYLLAQIVDDESVTAREFGHEHGAVGGSTAMSQRQTC